MVVAQLRATLFYCNLFVLKIIPETKIIPNSNYESTWWGLTLSLSDNICKQGSPELCHNHLLLLCFQLNPQPVSTTTHFKTSLSELSIGLVKFFFTDFYTTLKSVL